ncbi:Ld-bro-b [Lymantria dispar multiple nucleopolyhedrovirus]|jgi:prophage antirepressor-like protein|uniref:BRO-C n=1 Tax=Lymantria dispar multicapsid nuclear polyhedrosis virus TaxID=10449 RepID=Q9YMU1_NPVLD|nr:Ld-bro-b [Lymantria dispar multiple nucleopolyhedrovirus]AAC70218.1 Ld-bro-b [Lymantria dispar multiple nucleopolyhedrovirus]AMO27886.1 BRO-C [Lymantria dispar multiple nucleopolyhedrovirus]AMO65525.1 bro-c [Lymantria dispar multiple nucleopolyhedrovirus]
MSRVKIGQFKFGEEEFTLRYVLERDQSIKFVAKDVAASLKYVDCKQAVRINVDDKYKFTFEQGCVPHTLASDSVAKQGDPLYLHPHTVLITKEGVIQLIMKSKLPYAVELQAWLLEEVIPQVLCTGKYAPAVKMDTSGALVKIDDLTAKLTEANANLMEANKSLIVFANEMIVARRDAETARQDCEAARQDCEAARRETAQLANRMADIAQDVIAKPADPRLRHTLAVCEIGQNEYAFLRPQKRNFRQSLNRLSVDDRNVVFKSEYVPNAMNVLNKVKESLPRDKFKARHNKITLLENLTRDQLIEAVRSSMTERQIAKVLNK